MLCASAPFLYEGHLMQPVWAPLNLCTVCGEGLDLLGGVTCLSYPTYSLTILTFPLLRDDGKGLGLHPRGQAGQREESGMTGGRWDNGRTAGRREEGGRREDGRAIGGRRSDGRTADDGRQHPSHAGCTLGTRGRGERENDVVD